MNESRWIYESLDVFFWLFHTALIVFNVFGWIPRRSRRWHLGLIVLTLVSWLGLGFFYGFGYCILTDWHWDVKRALGHTDIPWSFTKLLFDTLTGLDWDQRLVDILTVAGLVFGVVGTTVTNVRDFYKGTHGES